MDARAVFRAGNEQIATLARRAPDTTARFICECDNPECLDDVPLTAAQYDTLRTQDRYLVVPGHERDDEPIERGERYTLVSPSLVRGA